MDVQEEKRLRDALSRDLMEVLIRVGLIGFLIVVCLQIFAPFASLMLWGLILAVSLYPLQLRLMGRLGGRSGLTATLIVLVLIVVIGYPTVVLAGLFVDQIHSAYQAFATNSVEIGPPAPSVAQWPLIGAKVYEVWSQAASDLPALLASLQPQLGNLSRTLLGIAAGTMGDVLGFIGALVIAGIMMAFGDSGSGATERILGRLSGAANGPRLHRLMTATIRSVATGVIGVAFIQALLLGAGFALAGIPASGLLAVIVMLLGILQLPAVLVSLPAIGYIWWAGDAGTVGAVVWTVYLMVAGMADNVLKPLLLGRGVDAPMPVVLIGALGGMISAGIVGLFIGAVLLAVGYQLFMDWVDHGPSGAGDTNDTAQGPDPSQVP
jgi:predicted PurR-regulated permease PerM